MTQTSEFMQALFAAKPNVAAITVWHRAKPARTVYYTDPDHAAREAAKVDNYDVYVGCGLAAKALPPTKTRPRAAEIVGIPGVWADIDVNGGPENKAGAAPNEDAAIELAGALLEPTLVVHSGYGIQAWWCFEGPMMFPTRLEQQQGAQIVAAFQGALRAAARRAGWGLDSTQDLARVMRIPGTFNHKGDTMVPVRLLASEGTRYGVDQIAELSHGHAPVSIERPGDLIVEVRQNGHLPSAITELMMIDTEFVALWKGEWGKKFPSPSEAEMSLTHKLVGAGLEDQEIADTLVAWRMKIEPGDPRHKCRAERIARTIAKARNGRARETQERERQDAAEELEEMGDLEKPDEVRTISLFNRVIGGPEVALLKQFSTDPKTARFVLVLADGTEVVFERLADLTNQERFREIYGTVTAHIIPQVKRERWMKATATLLKVRQLTDDPADSRKGRIETAIEEHLEAYGSEHRDGACAARHPFIEDGVLFLYAKTFVDFLHKRGVRTDEADVKAQLRVMGFHTRTINYSTQDGGRSTRYYYARPRQQGDSGASTE